MYFGYKISEHTAALARQAEADLGEVFKRIDEYIFPLMVEAQKVFRHKCARPFFW